MPPILEPFWYYIVRIGLLLDFSQIFLANPYARLRFSFLCVTKSVFSIQNFVVVLFSPTLLVLAGVCLSKDPFILCLAEFLCHVTYLGSRER